MVSDNGNVVSQDHSDIDPVLLGGLFMGSGDDGLFLRWLGAAVIAQLMAIATLMYGR